jgi:hypothetical protein
MIPVVTNCGATHSLRHALCVSDGGRQVVQQADDTAGVAAEPIGYA